MVTITIKELAQEARRLAEGEPERTAQCSYTHYVDGELRPNCIVGQAAFNLGVPLRDLEQVNSCSIRGLAGDLGYESDTVEWLDLSEDNSQLYMQWLSSLQGVQDGDKPWGEALRLADRFLVISQFNI